MIGAFARKLFGSSNERRIKNYMPRVAEISPVDSATIRLLYTFQAGRIR